jgi:hypothetical protein
MNLIEFCTLLRELGLFSLVETICAQHCATLAETQGRSQMPHANRARVAVVVALRANTGWSWRRLGQLFNREGTSLCRAVRLSSAREKRAA